MHWRGRLSCAFCRHHLKAPDPPPHHRSTSIRDRWQLRFLSLIATERELKPFAANERVFIPRSEGGARGLFNRPQSHEIPPTPRCRTSPFGRTPKATALTFDAVIDAEVERRSLGKDAVPMRPATERKYRTAATEFVAFRKKQDIATVTATVRSRGYWGPDRLTIIDSFTRNFR